MSKRPKYIVGVYRDTDRKSGPEGKFFQAVVAIVFDGNITHADMEHSLLGVISAGFVNNEGGEIYCNGRSETLNLESNPEVDNYFVRRALGVQGYREGDGIAAPMDVEKAMDILDANRVARRKAKYGG